MTVMDVRLEDQASTRAQTVLTPAQARLAHGMRHTTEANLKASLGECAFPVVSLHYDMVAVAVSALGLVGAAKDAFTELAGLPSELVAEVLK